MSEPVELVVERLAQSGEGTASFEGRTVFITGALPGERVRVQLREQQKILRGELVALLSESPGRRSPLRALPEDCGCDWLHLQEPLQRQAKEEIVLSALEHLGGIPRASLERRPIVASPRDLGYRRRAVLHFGPAGLGLHRPGTHDVLPLGDCPALLPALVTLVPRLSELLRPMAKDVEEVALLAVEPPGAGGPVEVGTGAQQTRVSVSVTLRAEVRPKHDDLVDKLQRTLGLRGVVLVPAPKKGPPREHGKPVLWTPAPHREGLSLFLRPDAFAQANAGANEALVGATLELCALQPTDRVLELYAGNGNFTFALSGAARDLFAVESSRVSMDLGERGRREGKVDNVRFIHGDALKVSQGLADEGQRFQTLVLDPPRTGAPGIAPLAERLGVRRVVYVACDPAALARDARALKDQGFEPRTLVVVDMFPQTHHVEAVLSLVKPAQS